MRMHILVMIIGTLTILSSNEFSFDELAVSVFSVCIYFFYVLGASIVLFALRNKIGIWKYLLGGLSGFFSLAWAWGFFQKNFVPDDSLTIIGATVHIILFGVFIEVISTQTVQIRENWYETAVAFQRRVDRSNNTLLLSGYLLFLFLIPFVVDRIVLAA